MATETLLGLKAAVTHKPVGVSLTGSSLGLAPFFSFSFPDFFPPADFSSPFFPVTPFSDFVDGSGARVSS